MPDWKQAVHERLSSTKVDLCPQEDVVEELAQHLDDRYGEFLTQGIPEDECRRRVEAELEDEDLLKCALLERRGERRLSFGEPPGRAGTFSGMSHQLKGSLRNLRTRPAFSLMIVGILALGIGGNAAIFSVFNSLYLRPLPFPESNRLVDLDETAPKWNLQYVGVSAYDLLSWNKNSSSFENMAFFRSLSYNVTSGEAAWHVQGAQVTHEMINVLRLAPALGRSFTEDEDKPGAAKVVLLGYNLWLRRFQGDRNVLGRVVRLDEDPYTIIGVLPRDAVFPDRVDLWVPLAPDRSRSTGYYVNGIGRLRAGVSISQAQADLLRVHKAMIAEGRAINEITSPVIAPIRDRYLGSLKNASRLLLGGVALVLLIACVDISALLLVRGASRSHEIAIRMAIGASRGRITVQLLTENLV